ncbi:hypothetical protein KMW28_03145 [Flammeovirga yaeyamensis]|uniref:DUF3857 domain-containing protein n=1 Tax=Flammeovirga yaeyamensis TaxID=367791 RepID=A0AAX1N5J2_9BACT|nr:hypothetical protein [Flammeovirga yaeyamensis]MBB3700514.1 hypothetical protein [Flammeovirga yaeyamensis]QWG02586.1 hypothetical protein KMW28_03145 [Flammeovirga yaeyamensis]
MMNNILLKKILLTLLVKLHLVFIIHAQDKPTKVKFGKISDKEWSINSDDIDADKVILHDIGVVQKKKVKSSTFIYSLKRNVRVKFLKEKSLSDNTLYLYLSKSKKDSELPYRANIFRKNKGKVSVEKADSIVVFANQNYSIVKVTFKNLMVGDIIDYEFINYFDLYCNGIDTWFFQNTAPTLLSEISFVGYDNFFNGVYQNPTLPEVKPFDSFIDMSEYGSYGFDLKNDFNGGTDFMSAVPQSVYLKEVKTWRKVNVPPLEEKVELLALGDLNSYFLVFDIKVRKNYIYKSPQSDILEIDDEFLANLAKMKKMAHQLPSNIKKYVDNFEVKHMYYGRKVKRFTKSGSYKMFFSWEEVTYQLQKDTLVLSKNLEDIILSKTSKNVSTYIKAENIYSFFQDHYKWNGSYSKETNSALIDKGFETGISNVAGINITLYHALKVLGLDAYLLYTSFELQGHLTYPTFNLLDYVIVMVVIDDKLYYLDATQKDYGLSQVPFHLLDKTFIVSTEKNNLNAKVIKLDSEGIFYIKNLVQLKISPTLNNAIGEQGIIYKGYAVDNVTFKNDFIHKSLKGKKIIIDSTKDKDNYRIEYDSLIINENKKYFIDLSRLIFSPKQIIELDNTDQLIDLKYKRYYKDIIQFELPYGYKVDNIPKEVTKDILGKWELSFVLYQTKNIVTIMLMYDLNKSKYNKSELKNLVMINDKITDYQNMKIEIQKL